MTRIGTGDQLLLVLQERLAALGRQRASSAARPSPREPGALARARALAAQDGLDPDKRRHMVVRGVLVQHLGDHVANDPAFAAVAETVTRILSEDEQGRALLDQVVAELSSPA